MADYTIPISTGRYQLTGNSVGLDVSDKPLGCQGVWITLDDAMVLLGAPSADEDQVQLLINSLTALLTSYLGRNLLLCTHTDTFFRPKYTYLKLQHYPIVEVYSIRSNGTRQSPNRFQPDYVDGYVYFDDCSNGSVFNPCDGTVTVNYQGGYAIPPMEVASVFRVLLQGAYGAIQTGGASAAVGEIKKVSLTGVATVEYQSSGINYSGVDQQLGVPNELKPYTGILDMYKSDSVMGVAL